MKKCIVLLLLLSGVQFSTQAQTSTEPQRKYIKTNMFWGNCIILGKIKGKFYYQLDLEMRRQADPNQAADPGNTVGSNRYNIIKNPYQDALRTWIHYQPSKFLRFSVSPFTWFGTWDAPVNGVTYFRPEFRPAAQVTMNSFLGRVIFNSRYRCEFRFNGLKTVADHPGDITGPSDSYVFKNTNEHIRIRYMLRALVPLNNTKIEKGTIYTMTSAELMFKFGTYVKNANVFDQYRIYLGIGWKFAPEIRMEAGYFNQMAFRFDNKAKNNVSLNQALFVNLIFDDFNSLFKKKDKTKE